MVDVRRAGALLLAMLVTVAVAAACTAGSDGAVDDGSAWKKAVLDHRAGTDAEFRTPAISPLTAVDRRVLRGAQPTHVEAEADGVFFSEQAGGDTALSFRRGPAGFVWERARGDVTATLRESGEPLAPGPVAQPAVFGLGRFSLLAQPVSGDLVVMTHDARRDEFRQFRGLSYFEPDRRYAVQARVERTTGAQQVTMPTTLKLEKTYHRYARLRFTIDGRVGELTAYRPVGARPGSLFIPFRDATAGASTYGGGRYLDLEEPSGDTVEIDFNRAYNPMCSYSPAYNCPIPPAENRLQLAIEAGEKAYAH